MRIFTRGLVALATGSLILLGFASSVGAGEVIEAAPLTIVKTVTGTAPAGTTFAVTVECFGGAVIEGHGTSAVVTFDATGQPTTPDVLSFSDGPGSCTLTETANGGASSTTYACTGSIPPNQEASTGPADVFPAQEEEEPVCPSAGPQSDPITVNVLDPDQEATVTVSNTFTTTPLTPVTPVQPAAQVVAQPSFTG